MKIVVLDGHALNPGDLDWAELRELGACEIHDRTPPAEVVGRAAGAAVVLTNKTPLPAGVIAQLPGLRYIGVLATGCNVVDVAAARARGIAVSNVPAYGDRSVAQHAFALLLELTQAAGHHALTVREGQWSRSPDWCYWCQPLVELDGLTLGIVGYGRIGGTVASLGRAFGMKIVAHSRTPRDGVENIALDDLFRRSDVVSLHCPLTSENRGMVDARRLALMKPTAFLLNTARGPLVEESALAAALAAGRLAGAGLDVLSSEPPAPDNPLLSAPNCLITPHLAWATRAARQRLMRIAMQNVRSFLSGRPQNSV